VSETHTEAQRAYPPSAEFAAQANATADLYREAERDRLAFWGKQADRLAWDTPFTDVLDWSGAPFTKWFVGGKLNVAYNCVDRHVEAGNGDRVAIHWEGEPVGDSRTITYAELKDEVSKAANTLTDLGLLAGDRVAIYMPMVPEAIVAILACARLGVMHSVVFAGFSASALKAPSRTPRPSSSSHRRAVPPRQRRRAEGIGGHRCRGPALRRARSGGAAHRNRHALDRRSRPVVARRRR
jgi:acetyl-CoA synthetase